MAATSTKLAGKVNDPLARLMVMMRSCWLLAECLEVFGAKLGSSFSNRTQKSYSSI